MRAKFSGRCTWCPEPIRPGDELSAMLGKWAHAECKSAELERRKAAGKTTVLPDDRGTADQPLVVGRKLGNRRRMRNLHRRPSR